ncbi:hypothetical protein HT031_006140 [Scenedesmus sp. PABB004]|nr:hypothetical protein HT031_006140 [Scenedesmus sp. PABB004]
MQALRSQAARARAGRCGAAARAGSSARAPLRVRAAAGAGAPRVVVTREAGKNGKLVAALARHGVECVELPLICHAPGPDRDALPGLLQAGGFDWVACTSPESAAVFIEGWRAAGKPKVRVAVVGGGTGEVLEAAGVQPEFTATKALGKVMGSELPHVPGGSGVVLYPASVKASTDLQDSLAAAGFTVRRINTYNTVGVDAGSVAPDLLAAALAADAVTFGSPSAVKAWVALVGLDAAAAKLSVCIGSTSARACDSAGLPADRVVFPDAPGIDAWAGCVLSALRSIDRLPAASRPRGCRRSAALARTNLRAAAGGGGDASPVHEVASSAEFDGIMQQLKDANGVGIIDFTAKWCGPCKAIAPVFEQLARQYPGVRFLKVDIDNDALATVVQDHGITGVPTFSLYKGARKVENFTGARLDLLKARSAGSTPRSPPGARLCRDVALRPRAGAVAARCSSSSSSGSSAGGAAEREQLHQLLRGRRVACLWDLDNLSPASLALDLLPAIGELQAVVAALGGRAECVRVYANPATRGRLGAPLCAVLEAAGTRVVGVPRRSQAADVQLTADACAFALAHGARGAIVCASNDTGFAPMLAYAGSQETAALTLAAFPSRRAQLGLLPDLRRHPLACVCHAALSWRPGAGAAARRLGSDAAAGAAPGAGGRASWSGSPGWVQLGAAAAAGGPAARGFIEALWLNPAKPLG